ncbi:hypothetical protein PF004_g19113 [Phytophthora fragariae]|uniref:Secreted protein n=1 Tax=Phytophthora fragariae TaxID=53985 RepID=A0A6A3J4C7_9STRA|nr:hypothetical protein PF011_g18839 [Phytophthora fragariae]KAE9200018.1 hypothetical protein PF004_g19113 [Phytophthora fragariae]KAE9321020.1 hypothetical protein PF008_g17906 [Phytophthora fragariae]
MPTHLCRSLAYHFVFCVCCCLPLRNHQASSEISTVLRARGHSTRQLELARAAELEPQVDSTWLQSHRPVPTPRNDGDSKGSAAIRQTSSTCKLTVPVLS